MTTISRLELATALADHLTEAVHEQHPHGRVYLGRVGTLPDGSTETVPVVDDRSQHVVPYTVIYPSVGAPTDEHPLDDRRGLDLTWSPIVTVAAGYRDDALRLLDTVTAACDGWTPTLDDALIAGPLTQLNDPGQLRPDEATTPARFYLPLTYTQTFTR